jgi:DNA polymerase III subunit gamma/tau
MSFYRIYRPQIIDEIDNGMVREQMRELLGKERQELPHAYLFSGSKGTGKTTAARLIAKLFNCTKLSKTTGPCSKCEQCVSVAAGTNMDVLEIDAASNRGIDEIRQLRERIGLAPSGGKYTVYIIDEVHMLTTEAFNALLKTLEEPPAHAIFVLATTDPHKVPATIKSRCMQVVFARARTAELINALRRISKAEKIRIDDAALTLIADYADGSFRDAVKTLEQISFHKEPITPEVLLDKLPISDPRRAETLLNYIAGGKTHEALLMVDELVREGQDLKIFITECLKLLAAYLKADVSGQKPEGNAAAWNIEDLKIIIRRFNQAYAEMRMAPIIQLPLELAIVEHVRDKQDSGFHPPQKDKTAEDDNRSAPPEQPKVRTTPEPINAESKPVSASGKITFDKLAQHWKDIIEELKPHNHSIAGVLRSARPKSVTDGKVVVEAFYKFHQEKLSEPRTKELFTSVLKKLFGETVKVEIVLGKK